MKETLAFLQAKKLFSKSEADFKGTESLAKQCNYMGALILNLRATQISTLMYL
jgi:hypothetical protein